MKSTLATVSSFVLALTLENVALGAAVFLVLGVTFGMVYLNRKLNDLSSTVEDQGVRVSHLEERLPISLHEE